MCCRYAATNGSKSKNVWKFKTADANSRCTQNVREGYIIYIMYPTHTLLYKHTVFDLIKGDRPRFPLSSGIGFGHLRFFAQPRREEAQTPCARLSTAACCATTYRKLDADVRKKSNIFSGVNHEDVRFIIYYIISCYIISHHIILCYHVILYHNLKDFMGAVSCCDSNF